MKNVYSKYSWRKYFEFNVRLSKRFLKLPQLLRFLITATNDIVRMAARDVLANTDWLSLHRLVLQTQAVPLMPSAS